MSEKGQNAGRYAEVYESWKRDPEGFWADAARDIDWIEQPKRIFDAAQGIYGRWFTGGVANTCYNCLDRHVERGRGAQPAVIYDSPVTGQKKIFTYAEMLDEVASICRRPAGDGHSKGRSRHRLHADDPGSACRDARVRTHRRNPLRRLRRVRG